MPSIRYRGINRFGNRYVVYQRGYWYGNASGSSYADDGAGHAHLSRASGGGWHLNRNRNTYSSGRHFRRTDSRHRRHQRRYSS